MSNFKKSKSEQFLEKRGAISQVDSSLRAPGIAKSSVHMSEGVPQVSALMAKSVSQFRRELLTDEVKQGMFRDGSGPSINEEGITSNAVVSSSVGVVKQAQVVSGGSNYRGGNGDVVKQTPEVYSPLWLNSNLNLPRDRPTINAWCRSFYALNPFVQNAINLHSTYPISKLNIKCPNKDIEKFFNDMIEEIDLMNICVQIAQEYWLLGESFVYAELDESKGKWNRLLIQNPDYMMVKRTVVANEPIIMLRPDENLKKIVFSNKPSDIEQRKQLNQHILESVKHGENIPLDNFHVSHLARRISPYEIRGTGLPVCIFRQLMLFDKLRECYDLDTEVLTDKGFKKINDLLTESVDVKQDVFEEIACVDPDSYKLEFHTPKITSSNFDGDLMQIKGKKVDCVTSFDSNLWVKEKTNGKWSDFNFKPSKSLLENKKNYKFVSNIEYVTDNILKTIKVNNVDIPIELYLKVLGYLISEGCIYSNYEDNRYDALISVNQLTTSDCYDDMRKSFDEFASLLNKNANHSIRTKGTGYSENSPKEMWSVSIHGKDIVQYFTDQIGIDGKTTSHFKRIPRWALRLDKKSLFILLESLIKGDGTEGISKYGSGSKNYKYSTVSKQLADDVYELVYKLGYVPNICVSVAKKLDDRVVTEYIVMWSDTQYGNQPNVMSYAKPNTNNGGGAFCNSINYIGKLYSINSPTGLVILRRNGKITIQGQGSFDESTEVLTHNGFKFISALDKKNNYVNGVGLDENGQISSILTMKEDFKVACVNSKTNLIEYHKPVELHMSKYTGEMINFKSRNFDIQVTPNHKMWVQKKTQINGTNDWSDFHKVKAQDISKTSTYRFQGITNWKGNIIDSVNVLDKTIPVNLYLKTLAYIISEGYLGQNYIDICQKEDSDCINDIKETFYAFSQCVNESVYERKVATKDFVKSGFKKQPSDRVNLRINSKRIMNYFIDQIGVENNSTSKYKKIPDWVKSLDTSLLKGFLNTLVLGDGSHIDNKNSLAWKYYTISPQLADDVQEIAFKCGYAPSISTKQLKSNNVEYCVSWSNAQDGNYPILTPNNSYPEKIQEVDYDGVVWCFEVPTGLFITRRNGKMTIQGNSKYAQADNMINPLTLVKIGSADFKPTFADLEAWRNVFECHDEETEVLTDQGFKNFNDVIDYTENDGQLSNIIPKNNIKIACFNPENDQLEYHAPLNASLYNYDGDMHHFANEKVDIKVTPNHKMWISEKKYEYNGHRSLRKTYYDKWKKVEAKDIILNDTIKFRSQINWEGVDLKEIDICGKNVPIELYLEFLGYLLSEGCLYTNHNSTYLINVSQTVTKYYEQMKTCFDRLSLCLDKSYCSRIEKRSEYTENCQDIWTGTFNGKAIYDHFKNEVQDKDGGVKSYNKCIPRWILNLNTRLLKILLNALLAGDGSTYINPNKTSHRFAYYTTSKQLADDVYEIAYKCGYVPTVFVKNDMRPLVDKNQIRKPIYNVLWSETNVGHFPIIYKTSRNSQTKEKHNILNIEKYKGKVWCFEVPTGLFITRRNGKITIQSNSAQYDKDFKIFTHEGVAVERVGYNQGIYDISGDITQIIKEIYVGLQVPPVLMDGGADTTYSNGGVALDVLRQRYMQFRNMMSIWLKRKIFAPISKIQGFYDYSGGEKQLIVPDIDWNHMSLFDAGDYINNLVTLTQGEGSQKRASLHTLYRSMGLEYEDEARKMRKEAVQLEIFAKEKVALQAMNLNALRALDEEDEIPEPEVQPGSPGATPTPGSEQPLPGESGGLPGLDMGSLPPPPPPMSGPPGTPPPPPPPPPSPPSPTK